MSTALIKKVHVNNINKTEVSSQNKTSAAGVSMFLYTEMFSILGGNVMTFIYYGCSSMHSCNMSRSIIMYIQLSL